MLPNPDANGLGCSGLMRSPSGPPKCPPSGIHGPFFFLDLELSLRLRVWIPSFFMVSGLFTCSKENLGNVSEHQRLIP